MEEKKHRRIGLDVGAPPISGAYSCHTVRIFTAVAQSQFMSPSDIGFPNEIETGSIGFDSTTDLHCHWPCVALLQAILPPSIDHSISLTLIKPISASFYVRPIAPDFTNLTTNGFVVPAMDLKRELTFSQPVEIEFERFQLLFWVSRVALADATTRSLEERIRNLELQNQSQKSRLYASQEGNTEGGSSRGGGGGCYAIGEGGGYYDVLA
ncbi:hypothetical protein SO802_006276 [Lithocarpus litseifolius]|uniref:Uncharacterized protein n=1 Tax=Lithocarpus litseifolius TaxID=425828 RepID=A0AAW2DNL7_9ROSI